MTTEIMFSIQAQQFAVYRDPDGLITWSEYDGQKVDAAFPSADGTRCILLLDRSPTTKYRFENLFCVDHDGRRVWTAKLPDPYDWFMDADMRPDGLHAGTWGCYNMTFDPVDGRILHQVFTK